MTEYTERPNKTRQKRELAEIHLLAEQLTDLDSGKLAQFDLDARTVKAIIEAKNLKASSARKRLLKFVTKLLLDEDWASIKAHFDQNSELRQRENQAFHALERWRDRLISEGDPAMQALLVEYPRIERQPLRQAMMAAAKERATGKPVGATKKLFRLLREQATTSA